MSRTASPSLRPVLATTRASRSGSVVTGTIVGHVTNFRKFLPEFGQIQGFALLTHAPEARRPAAYGTRRAGRLGRSGGVRFPCRGSGDGPAGLHADPAVGVAHGHPGQHQTRFRLLLVAHGTPSVNLLFTLSVP